jgi:hypothetical protein
MDTKNKTCKNFLIRTNIIIFIITTKSIMTKEEIENTYEFKIIKKAVMREFPFIKDIIIREEDEKTFLGYKYIYFITAIIDPFVMTNLYGGQVWEHIITIMKKNNADFESSFLATFVRSEDRKIIGNVQDDIRDLIRSIHETKTLPNEFKLDKYVEIDTFIAKPSSIPPLYNSGK